MLPLRDLADHVGRSLLTVREGIEKGVFLRRNDWKMSQGNMESFIGDSSRSGADVWSTSVENGKKSSATGKNATQAAGHVITREELGRATWLVLHSIAAQYPEKPTRRQKKDARVFIDALSRMYPCAECAEHFQNVVASHPPDVKSREAFSHWMCRVHNVVNRSLGKPVFNCDLALSRWSGFDCGDDNACNVSIGHGGAQRRGLHRNARI